MVDVTDTIKETSGISIISGVDIVSVIFPELKFAIINERELSKKDRVHVKSNEAQHTKQCFHGPERRGICSSRTSRDYIFVRIVKRSLGDVERDYLYLSMKNKLYVPTDQVYQISQYNSGGDPLQAAWGV